MGIGLGQDEDTIIKVYQHRYEGDAKCPSNILRECKRYCSSLLRLEAELLWCNCERKHLFERYTNESGELNQPFASSLIS